MIKAVEHGGNLAHLAALAGYEPTDCIDFSANINPLGLSRAVRNHLIRELDHLTVYPDVKQRQARDYLATYHGLEPENFLLCNGAVEAFYDFEILAVIITLTSVFVGVTLPSFVITFVFDEVHVTVTPSVVFTERSKSV